MIYIMKMSVPPCQVFFGVASELAVAPLPQVCFHAKLHREACIQREREREKKNNNNKIRLN